MLVHIRFPNCMLELLFYCKLGYSSSIIQLLIGKYVRRRNDMERANSVGCTIRRRKEFENKKTTAVIAFLALHYRAVPANIFDFYFPSNISRAETRKIIAVS